MATIDPSIVANMTITPYVWEAMRNGVVCAVEYPPGDVPETPFAAIGMQLRLRGDLGREVPTFVNTTGETLRMKARSLREATCPMIEVDILPGDALVWGHKRVHTVIAHREGALGSASVTYETLIFGRESSGGEVAMIQIWPTGETNSFDSYAAAMTAL